MMGFGPGGLDCDQVLSDVYLYLDGEADDALRQRISVHLDECGPCLRQAGLEREVKALVARCCGNDVAPEQLHQRIRVRLTQVSVHYRR